MSCVATSISMFGGESASPADNPAPSVVARGAPPRRTIAALHSRGCRASYVSNLNWCKQFCSNFNNCVGVGYSHRTRLCTMHSNDQNHYDLTRSNYGSDMRYHKRGRGISDAYQCQAVCAGYGGCTAFSFDTTLRRCELHTNSGAVPQHARDGDINWISGKRRCLPGVCEFCRPAVTCMRGPPNHVLSAALIWMPPPAAFVLQLTCRATVLPLARLQDGCPQGFVEAQTCASEHNRLCLLPTWVHCANEGGTCSCTGQYSCALWGPSS